MHTSGVGVSAQRAHRLKAGGLRAAAVGLDDVDLARHDHLRGYPGAHAAAASALRIFHEAGIFTYVNMCLSRELIRSGELWDYYDFVKGLHVGFIQMLEPRPCGGYLHRGDEVLVSEDDRAAAKRFADTGNTERRYRQSEAPSAA